MSLLILSAALAVGGTVAHSASAVTVAKPQLSDPSGDSLNGGATDIVSGQFATTGTTTVSKVKGKRVTTYKPKNLVVTLTLAAPPSTSLPSKYEFNAVVGGCGYIQFSYTPGALSGPGAVFTQCPTGGATGGGTLITTVPVVSGNAITFTVAISALPSDIKLGSVVSKFTAYTAIAEPVTGVIDTGILMPFDDAASDVTWKLG